jgi:glutaredoxin 3
MIDDRGRCSESPNKLEIMFPSRNMSDMSDSTKRQVIVFSAGCPLCEETVDLVQSLARPSDEVTILDMHERDVTKRARLLGIRSVPAVLVGGKLVGPDENALREAGLGF